MATYPQRASAVCDALLNAAATAEQRDRISKAFAAGLPADATQAQIAAQFLKELRQYVLDRITSTETQSGITALRESKAAQVPIDFPETP